MEFLVAAQPQDIPVVGCLIHECVCFGSVCDIQPPPSCTPKAIQPYDMEK